MLQFGVENYRLILYVCAPTHFPNPKINSKPTEAHSAQSRQYRQHDDPEYFPVDGQIEHVEAEQDHQCGLAAHHQELGGHVGKQNLHPGDTGHQTTLQDSLVPFDQHRSGGQRHR